MIKNSMKKLTVIGLCLSVFLFASLNAIQLNAQPLNNHLIFDGVNDYVSLNNMDVSGSAITLEALINSSDLDNCINSDCRIISKTVSDAPADHYWMLSTTKSNGNIVVRFRLKTNGTTTTLIAPVGFLSNNTWYHLAATYDGANMKTYLNGTEIASSTKTGSITTNPSVQAWVGGNPPLATIRPWQGGIDEVRIWNTARTQAEIQANRSSELTGNEPGLQAYYKFNEGIGQTINDQAGNNNTVLGSTNATDANDPAFANPNPNPTVTFNLKVFLEGPFDVGQGIMDGSLLQLGVVPQGQPYTGSPWNYPGTEGNGWLPTDYPVGTLDWVLVSLRTSLDPATEVARVAAVLLENGNISSFDVNLNNATNPLYVMIEHRNHLPIISAQPISIVNNTISYDFTASNSYTTGSGFGQKRLGSDWVMYGGNADQEAQNSCDINASDRVFWQTVNGQFDVYNPGDYDLDGDVNAADRIVFNSNNGIFTTVPKSNDTTNSAPPVLTCPAPNYVLDNCSYTVNWVHNNPLSTTVNYDLRINGIDPGPSVVYPANSNTIDICSLLGISSGTGSFTVELIYWYDGDLTNMVSAGVCTVNYDLPSNGTIHNCFGFNLIDRINTYQPPNLLKTPTQTFTSLTALQNKINSLTDHNGAVYALAAGTYAGELRIVDKRNLCVYTNPNNPATINATNRNFGIYAYNSTQGVNSNLEILNFRVTGAKFHGIYIGGDDAPRFAPRGTWVAGNEVFGTAQITGGGIVVRNAFEGADIRIEANEVYNIAPTNLGAAGEGIYIGEGNDLEDYSSNVQIVGNYLHDLTGEAIDIKRKSANILIEYNKIDQVNVHSQGAIVLGLDPLKVNDTYDAQFIVRRNCISNVTTRNADGNFIVVGNAYTLIEENVMWNTVKHGIEVYNDCDGANKTVIIKNNIIWGYVGQPIRSNVGSGNGGPNNPCTVTRATNIVQSNPVGSECQEPASIFVGPLTTCTGFAPK